MDNIAISLENISKIYKLYKSKNDHLKDALNPFGKVYHREFFALRDINLDIAKGTFLGILGRNGAGKSTLLKIIASSLTPTTGSVRTNGQIVPLINLGAGFNPNYTGLQNIYFYGAIMGFSRPEMKEMEKRIIDFADIEDFIEQPLKTYSSGMRARLGFAVATEINPEILIVDEVLAVGDIMFRRKCYQRMQKIMDHSKAILYVTHTPESIVRMCNQAILMDRGEIILSGEPKTVSTAYQRLMNANKADVDVIRNEVIAENKKKKSNHKNKEIDGEKKSKYFEAHYIPNFKSKSTQILKDYDIDMFDMKMSTKQGKEVNHLVTDEEYIFSYKIRFNVHVKSVIFFTVFRTTQGINMGACYTPGLNTPMKNVKIKEIYEIKLRFKCIFLNETYFITIGVFNEAHKELAAVIDAYAFKVESSEFKNKFMGLVKYEKQHNIINHKNPAE